MHALPRLSVIIPARNEEAYLPRLLDSVGVARDRYARGVKQIEIIVSDNASKDRTTLLARERRCVVTQVKSRSIGAVRNGGARIAHGAVFLFADADLELHPETFNELERALQDSRVIAGRMAVRWDRFSLGLFATNICSVLYNLFGRCPLGRPGTTFCRRKDYEAVGGYREDSYFGGDRAFIKALRDLGRRDGRPRFVCCRRAKAVASTRKMKHFGDWHLVKYYFLVVRLRLAVSTEARIWARASLRDYWFDYWYNDRR